MQLPTRSRVLAAGVAAALLAVTATSAPALATASAGSVSSAGHPSPGAAVSAASSPPVPQHDAFYRAPSGWRATRPGTILRHRPVTLAAFSLLPQHIQSWQLMFRTTSTTGAPLVAVTTVLLPAGGTPKALLSYQVAEDAAAPQCAPSYELRLSGSRTEAVNQAELLLIDAAVGEGFAVSVPDYEGVAGNFGVAKQPGYIVLDGLRAAEHFAPLGLPGGKTRTGIWGYSGGSLASGWAAQVQHRYAPHLRVGGIALGGFVTDIPQALLKINGGPASGLIASVLPGVIRGDTALAKLLRPELTATGKQVLAHAGTQCEVENVAQYPFLNFNRDLKHSIPALLGRPAFRKQIDRLNLGGSAPTAPLFVYHAVNDELIPVAGPDAMVKSYCARGSSVTYTRDEASEHGSLAVIGAPTALDWLSAHTIGHASQHGCTTTTVPTMAFSPSSLSTLPVVVQSILLALAGLPVGGAIS